MTVRLTLITTALLLALAAPAAAAGPFDALPAPGEVAADDAPLVRYRGVLPVPGTPTPLPREGAVTDRGRFYALPGARITVVSGEERLRVDVVRVTRTGRAIRRVLRRRSTLGTDLRFTLPRTPGAMHAIRVDAGDLRRSTRYVYTPASGGRTELFLDRPAFRPGEAVTGQARVTGDTAVQDGCPQVERLDGTTWTTAVSFACTADIRLLPPGTTQPLRLDLPADLAPGRHRVVEGWSSTITGGRGVATAEFDVVR